MKIVVLVDNNPNPDNTSLEVEHGLSFYIEIGDKKLLLDVGSSDKFLSNAQKLNIDISDIEYLILSHAHNDHTGGLKCFLQNNDKAQIYLSSNISDISYYSNRRGFMRNISIEYNLINDNESRFIRVSDDIQLSPFVSIIHGFTNKYPLPKANSTLYAGTEHDNFNHEIALLLKEDDKTVLLSSCTHSGLMNTLNACKHSDISTFIGGLHLVDSDENNIFESEDDIHTIGNKLISEYPQMNIFTGHCTGGTAQAVLSDMMKEHFHSFYVGFEL